jgi:hypothetical protein
VDEEGPWRPPAEGTNSPALPGKSQGAEVVIVTRKEIIMRVTRVKNIITVVIEESDLPALGIDDVEMAADAVMAGFIFHDPVFWQKLFGDTMQLGLMPRSLPQPMPGIHGEVRGTSEPIMGRIESISIILTEEERKVMVDRVSEAIKPQLAEFETFVNKGLQDMPAHRLKKISDAIEAGNKPKITQRPGCIFIKASEKVICHYRREYDAGRND